MFVQAHIHALSVLLLIAQASDRRTEFRNALNPREASYCVLVQWLAEGTSPMGSSLSQAICVRSWLVRLISDACCAAEAESYYQCRIYPKAAIKYRYLLDNSPNNMLRPCALARLYAIGSDWLDDTYVQMSVYQRYQATVPAEIVNLFVYCWRTIKYFSLLDVSKPFFNSEACGLRLLASIDRYEPGGPYTDRALFLVGSVHFFRHRFHEAEACFLRLVETCPNSPLIERSERLILSSRKLTLLK